MELFPVQINSLCRKGLPKYFNKGEVLQILSCADNERDRLLIEFMWRTGARISEALNVKKNDVDFVYHFVYLNTLKRKGKPIRSIPLHVEYLERLNVLTYLLDADQKIFPITRQRAYDIIREACRKAGIDEKRSHPHTFRHSFAVLSVVSRVPIMVVKSWLGHANIQNTLIYTQVFDQDARHFYDALSF